MNKVQISSVTESFDKVDISTLAKDLFDSEDYANYKKGESHYNDYIRETLKKVLAINDLNKVHVEVILNNCPPEVANALQRASTSEQDYYAFEVHYDNIQTTDKDMNKTELLDNITFIPLRYGISETEFRNAEFFLDIRNDGHMVRPILTGDLKVKGYNFNKHLFHPTMELIYLNPGCRLIVKNITISKNNTEEHTKYLTATNGCTWPLDRPKDAKTSNFTAMKHRVSFNVQTVLPEDKDTGVKILTGGCHNIISRLQHLMELITGEDSTLYFKEFKDHSELDVIETNTIAKLIERVCHTLYPKVSYISAEISYHTKLITIHIYGTDSKNILINTIKESIKIYGDILNQL